MVSSVAKALAVFVLLGSCTGETLQNWIAREDSVGPVRVGVTPAQLNSLLHEKLKEESDAGSESCYYLESKKHPNLRFMISDNRLARVDVIDRRVPTTNGIRVGDAEKHALEVYGPALKITPHQYIDDGHYLTLHPQNRKYGIRFETENGKITMFYVGTFEAIQYVEGCL